MSNPNSTNTKGSDLHSGTTSAQCESLGNQQDQFQQLAYFAHLHQLQQLEQQQQQQQQQQPIMGILCQKVNVPSSANAMYQFPSSTGSVPQHQQQSYFSGQLTRDEHVEPQQQRFRRRRLNEREEFFMFIKILFRFLEGHEDDARSRLRQRAKAVVTECTKRNRQGDADYMPLTDAVERLLRPTVGERYWTLAKKHLDHFMQQGVTAATATITAAV